MLFTTPEQFVILAILLLAGWLLGYASAPNVKKWRRKVQAQSDSFTAYHRDAEDKLRAANRRAADLSAETDALRADHAEAERLIASLRANAATAVTPRTDPVPVVTPAAIAPAWRPALALVETPPAEAAPVAQSAARSAFPVAPAPPAVAPIEPEPIDATVEEPAPAPPIEQDVVTVPEGAPPGATFPDHADSDAASAAATALPAQAAAPAPDMAETPATDLAPPAATVVPMTPVASSAEPAPIGPAEPAMPSKGWFASSARDDLTRLRGIDGALNTRLFGLGVTRFEDIARLSAEDEMALEQRLALPAGYIAREQWRAQAALLRAGKDEEHAAQFGAVEA